MANRQTTFLLKRSNVPGKIPSSSGLTLGEMALNTADAILYTSGTTANSILPIGWDRIHRTGDTVFGDFAISGSSLPSGYALSVTGDTNFVGDIYVQGDLNYDGNLIVSGGTIVESGFTANTIYTDYIDFNTGATVTSSNGRIYWDSGTGTLNVSVGDTGTGLIDLQVGQEEIVRVYNDEATTLVKGEIVYVSGSQGNRPKVKRALATSDGYSVTTLGMVDRNIASGAEGYVTTFGIISNLNTLGLTGGTAIWLSGTIPGGYTSVKPIAPLHTVLIGYVVRVDNNVGSIFVNISNGWELDELHDVRISAATEGDLLMRSSFSGSPVWVNTKTLNGSYTITGNTNIGGNLTVSGNSGVNWFSSNTSSDLVRITQTGSGNAFVVEDITRPDSTPFVIDASGNTGIGTTTPSAKLDIFASSALTNTLRIRDTGNTFNNLTINSQGLTELRTNGGGGLATQFSVVHNGGTENFRVRENGNISFRTANAFDNSSQMSINVGRDLTNGLNIGPLNTYDTSNTNRNLVGFIPSFSWAGGNNTGSTLNIAPTYNIIGGSTTALVRGIYYNPSLQSLSGTTHRAIETTTGDVIFGSTSGNVGIGTTTPRQKLDVSGNTIISSGLTAQTAVFSSSSQNVLTVVGSGNSTTSPIFSVQGSSGELFSVSDSLTGSLFSVNDISGLPIVEVFSDNTTLMGSYLAPSLNTTTRTSLSAGTNTIYSIPTSAYTGAFFEYTLISTGSTGARAGQIMSIWSGTTAQFTETSTLDIGSTTGVTFNVIVSGNNALLRSSATTAGWTVKTIVRSI